MEKELSEEQKNKLTRTNNIIVLIAIVLSIVVFIVAGKIYLNEYNKSEAEKAADLASQYTVKGKIEKVTIKTVEATRRSTVEYHVWLNGKVYKLPNNFTGDVHKGSQVTLVGDRKHVSSIEIEK